MLGVAVVYAGLAIAFAGLASVARPLALLGVHTRLHGALILGAGLLIAVVGAYLPAREIRVKAIETRLDEFAPVYQFHEIHTVRIRAPRERVFRAIQAVTPREIAFFQTLTWIRRFGRSGPESILTAPEKMPLLEFATRTGFLPLAEEPNREIVIGTLVGVPAGWRPKTEPTPEKFKALDAPGFAKATMNFRLEDAGAGTCVVTTETRIYATDASAARRFGVYWRVIYPGSALIRRMWLRAIRLRAELADP
jgi:hypothetical protein